MIHPKDMTFSMLGVYDEVHMYVRDHTPNTDPQLKEPLADSLTQLIFDMVAKFDKGQLEHKDKSILEIDHEHEIYCELIDAFMYNASKTWKKKLEKQ